MGIPTDIVTISPPVLAIMGFSPALAIARGYYQDLLVRNDRTRPVGHRRVRLPDRSLWLRLGRLVLVKYRRRAIGGAGALRRLYRLSCDLLVISSQHRPPRT